MLVNENDKPRSTNGVPSSEEVRRRLEDIRTRIASAGREPREIEVVAVTKGFGPEHVVCAMSAGLCDIGENYAQELLAKSDALRHDPHGFSTGEASPFRWHYLGRIQRRKVRDLAEVVSLWQSVSRPEEAESISRHAPGASVLVEVEATGLPGRNGCPVECAEPLAQRVRDLGLDLRGLMTVGPPGGGERAREVFGIVGRLAETLGLAELSMGMSDDLEAAVREGATMVRVGRALFGERDTICR